MYQIQISIEAFGDNNRNIFRVLKEYIINSPGLAWIERFNATENGCEVFWVWSDHYSGQGGLSKRTHLALATLKTILYNIYQLMAFDKYSEILTKASMALDKYPDKNKMSMQKVEVLLDGIKTAETELIAFKAIIGKNYACGFSSACSHLLALIVRFHGGA